MAGRPIALGLAEAGVAQVRAWKRPPWRPEHLDASAHPAIRMTEFMEEAVGGADLVLSLVTTESALGYGAQAPLLSSETPCTWI